MMGRLDRDQEQFFYEYRLDDLVPADHLVRKLDTLVDLSWLRAELAPYYSHTGRPSIDPELMVRMLLVGYVFAIRSERQLCSELQVNMAYRWFCGLSIESHIPDHSLFSRARHERFRAADLLRRVFEHVVDTCIATGLVGGEAFSVDASLIQADVNQVRRVPGDQPVAWPEGARASRAVREYLQALDEESDTTPNGGGKQRRRMAISLTDPQATWAAYRRRRSIFAYHTPIIYSTTKPASSSMPRATGPTGLTRTKPPSTWWRGSPGALRSNPNGLPPTPPMAAPPLSSAWSSTALSRTFR